jgi:RND family efflux transporter MFP subunit
VAVTQARRDNWETHLTASGSVSAWQEAVVASELGGLRVTKLAADIGSEVRKGQVIVELARDTVEAGVAQQHARVAAARATREDAKANADRARLIQASGALSSQQIEQYLTAERTTDANLMQAVAVLRSENLRLAQTRILAPDDGIVSSRSAVLGSVAQPGAELFRMVRQGRLEWRAELTAERLGQVKPGQKVRVKLANGTALEGVVRMSAPTFDASSRNALVYVSLPKGSAARAGMFATGEIQAGTRPVTVIPSAALVLRDGFSYVFVVARGTGEVAQLKVEVGMQRNNEVEILTALPEHGQVVVQGGAFLNHGDRVRVEPAGAPVPAERGGL